MCVVELTHDNEEEQLSLWVVAIERAITDRSNTALKLEGNNFSKEIQPPRTVDDTYRHRHIYTPG